MQFAMLLLPVLMHQDGGLKVTDLKVGSGPAAVSGDYLTMDYTGTLLSGKQFDSSIGRAPFNFVLGAGMVIKGWDKGVVGMKVGGKRVLVIPATLGYGAQAAGEIPPNSTLKFVIELKKIQPLTELHNEVIRAGHGAPIKGGDTVVMHILGTLKDGKKLMSTYDQGKPATLRVGSPGMPPGILMGILGMKEGEKKKVTVPYDLGLGEAGHPPQVPPKSELVFTLEVVQVTR